MNFINGNNEASFLTRLSEVEVFLQVPTPFAKKYLEKSSSNNNNNSKKQQPKIVLKTKSGLEEWEVQYLKIKEEHYFINGWIEFVKDNNLQNGDTLIFCLTNKSDCSPNLTLFEVFFYGQNGCPKNTIISVNPNISDNNYAGSSHHGKKRSIEKLEASDDYDADSSKNVNSSEIFLTKVVRKSYTTQMQLSKCFVKAAGIDSYGHLQLENDEGKKWDVNFRKWGRDEMPQHIVGGWSKFLEDNKVKAGNWCDIYHVKDNVLHVHVYKNRGEEVL